MTDYKEYLENIKSKVNVIINKTKNNNKNKTKNNNKIAVKNKILEFFLSLENEQELEKIIGTSENSTNPVNGTNRVNSTIRDLIFEKLKNKLIRFDFPGESGVQLTFENKISNGEDNLNNDVNSYFDINNNYNRNTSLGHIVRRTTIGQYGCDSPETLKSYYGNNKFDLIKNIFEKIYRKKRVGTEVLEGLRSIRQRRINFTNGLAKRFSRTPRTTTEATSNSSSNNRSESETTSSNNDRSRTNSGNSTSSNSSVERKKRIERINSQKPEFYMLIYHQDIPLMTQTYFILRRRIDRGFTDYKIYTLENLFEYINFHGFKECCEEKNMENILSLQHYLRPLKLEEKKLNPVTGEIVNEFFKELVKKRNINQTRRIGSQLVEVVSRPLEVISRPILGRVVKKSFLINKTKLNELLKIYDLDMNNNSDLKNDIYNIFDNIQNIININYSNNNTSNITIIKFIIIFIIKIFKNNTYELLIKKNKKNNINIDNINNELEKIKEIINENTTKIFYQKITNSEFMKKQFSLLFFYLENKYFFNREVKIFIKNGKIESEEGDIFLKLPFLFYEQVFDEMSYSPANIVQILNLLHKYLLILKIIKKTLMKKRSLSSIPTYSILFNLEGGIEKKHTLGIKIFLEKGNIKKYININDITIFSTSLQDINKKNEKQIKFNNLTPISLSSEYGIGRHKEYVENLKIYKNRKTKKDPNSSSLLNKNINPSKYYLEKILNQIENILLKQNINIEDGFAKLSTMFNVLIEYIKNIILMNYIYNNLTNPNINSENYIQQINTKNISNGRNNITTKTIEHIKEMETCLDKNFERCNINIDLTFLSQTSTTLQDIVFVL